MLFIHLKNSFSSQEIENFVLNFCSCRKSGLIRDMVTFKICDIMAWLANNCNTEIAQYLTGKRQPDNKTWSVNRI